MKSARKDLIPGRKQALVRDNGKSVGEELRMLPSYTFYRMVLQKNLRQIFGFSEILPKSENVERSTKLGY